MSKGTVFVIFGSTTMMTTFTLTDTVMPINAAIAGRVRYLPTIDIANILACGEVIAWSDESF